MLLRLQFLGLLAALPARAEPSPFEPQQYLDQKAFEAAQQAPQAGAVKQDVVKIDGRPYYKFGAGGSSILVPKVDHLSEADLQRAICAEDLQDVCDPSKGSPDDPHRQEMCRQQGVKDALAARAQQELTKDTVVYAGLIVATIQTTCGGTGRRPNAKQLESFFEVGVEHRHPDPRHPGSEKVFVRPNPRNPRTPEVGAGLSF
jgi:hypothetical protein